MGLDRCHCLFCSGQVSLQRSAVQITDRVSVSDCRERVDAMRMIMPILLEHRCPKGAGTVRRHCACVRHAKQDR